MNYGDVFKKSTFRTFGGPKVPQIQSQTPAGVSGRSPAFERGPKRNDPYLGYRFQVELEGILVGGFQTVSGLSIEIDVQEVKEGGVNSYVHRIPSGVKYSDIVLTRGIVDQDQIWGWYKSIVDGGPVVQRSGSIRVLDDFQKTVAAWDFIEAYPIKWSGDGFDAEKASILTESITLVHHGLFRIK